MFIVASVESVSLLYEVMMEIINFGMGFHLMLKEEGIY